MSENTLIKKERSVGLDILRIFAMFLMTARHYLGYSGVAEIIGFDSFNGILMNIISVLAQSSANIFVLISGYFLVNSKFKVTKIIKIWAETWFYSVVFFGVGILINSKGISFANIVFTFFPLISRHYWFAVAYIALLAVSPFLNKMIKTLSYKEFSILVFGGAVILSAWTTIIYFSQGVVMGGNTGLLWFMYLYLIGAYINTYKEKIKCGIVTWGAFIISFIIVFSYFFLSSQIPFLKNFPIKNDESIFNLIISVSLFIVFLNIKINNEKIKKIIASISISSFGIYLIQENCMIRYYLWKDLADANKFAVGWQLFSVLIFSFIILTVLSFFCKKIFNVVYDKCYILVKKIVMKVKRK